MYGEFLNVAKRLNSEFNIIPLLYGSLGLKKVTNVDFCPDDIDILIPELYLENKWNDFKKTIEMLEYTLVDLHEHKFVKKRFKIAFASIEDLESFAGIDIEHIENHCENGTRYKLLNIEEYLEVYTQSSKDGYRREKNNNKDLLKIEKIKLLLNK
ncbi:MAG: hypothetical protein FH761_08625 [Firmicutes bacterium]|nr:hypothetical protein [Bacillota bacterium]